MWKKSFFLGILLIFAAGALFWRHQEDTRETVLTAFEKANFEDSSCHIYREGYLDDAYYMIEEKKDFLESLFLELKKDETGNFREEHLESGNSVVYEWMDESGDEQIRLTFLTKEETINSCEIREENYLRTEIYFLNGVSAGKALEEQNRLEEAAEECGLEEPVYMEMEGVYDSRLSRQEQRIVVEALLDEMRASKVDDVDEELLYTVYAYAKGGGREENIAGKQVNLNLAVSYDEIQNKTVFRLGCPLIGTDY